jgi:hypothetical protein
LFRRNNGLSKEIKLKKKEDEEHGEVTPNCIAFIASWWWSFLFVVLKPLRRATVEGR